MNGDHERRPLFLRHPIPHYYGDIVRRCFVLAGIVLLAATLFDQELLTFYLSVGIFGALLVTVLAGLTSPRSRQILFIEAAISAVMFLLFEYFAVASYLKTQNFTDTIFLLRQVLALTFLVALYFSTKTVRGMIGKS